MPEKLQNLISCLKDLKGCVIAFSGGVDSTFLLAAAVRSIGKENILAVIAESPTYPSDEVAWAKKICEECGVKYKLIQTDEFSDENFVSNPKERCYYCKKELFSRLNNIAKENGIEHVLDGSNFDDKSDYRPGTQAKCELGVKSPLQEIGFTKQNIRDISKEWDLPTWDKPSYACLASRIPYGTRITEGILGKVRDGEGFLKSLGFKQVRVRHHGSIVRIELENRVLALDLMDKITEKFEKLGYTYVTLDLKGYRTGSMNEALSS